MDRVIDNYLQAKFDRANKLWEQRQFKEIRETLSAFNEELRSAEILGLI